MKHFLSGLAFLNSLNNFETFLLLWLWFAFVQNKSAMAGSYDNVQEAAFRKKLEVLDHTDNQ
jgi:hypothetical protein